MRAIAITSTERVPLVPQIPTIAEAGVPGYEFTQWYALLAPAKTPREIVAILNAALLKSMHDSDVKARVGSEGGVFTPQTPEQFSAFLSTELQKNAKTIRDAGLKRE
jgi:tripartite-type tricarboxylate transporter receptor subunit TctC